MAVFPNLTNSAQVTVPTTGIRLDIDESDAVSGTETFTAKYGRSVWITVGGTDIYIGGDANVRGGSPSSPQYRGRLVKAGSELVVDLQPGETLYGATASGTSVCERLVTGA